MKITTDRLLLRPFELNDVGFFAAISADPEVMRYIGGGPINKQEAQKNVEQFIKHYQNKGYSLFAIIHQETKKFIGFCGLIDQVVNDHNYVELGYRLDRKWWHQGIATEAALAVKAHAFNMLQLPKLISIIQPGNAASISVAKKLNMKLCMRTLFNQNPVIIYHCENVRLYK